MATNVNLKLLNAKLVETVEQAIADLNSADKFSQSWEMGDRYQIYPKFIRDDEKVVMHLTHLNSICYKYLSDEVKSNKLLNLKLLDQNNTLFFEMRQFWDDEDIAYKAISKNGYIITLLSEKFKKDKKFIYKSLETDPIGIEYLSSKIPEDKILMLKTIKENLNALTYLNPEDPLNDNVDLLMKNMPFVNYVYTNYNNPNHENLNKIKNFLNKPNHSSYALCVEKEFLKKGIEILRDIRFKGIHVNICGDEPDEGFMKHVNDTLGSLIPHWKLSTLTTMINKLNKMRSPSFQSMINVFQKESDKRHIHDVEFVHSEKPINKARKIKFSKGF
jgi:hypothetical protein